MSWNVENTIVIMKFWLTNKCKLCELCGPVFCYCWLDWSGTVNFDFGIITIGSKQLDRKRNTCYGKISLAVIGSLFKNVEKSAAKSAENFIRNVMTDLGRDFEMGGRKGSVYGSNRSKAA